MEKIPLFQPNLNKEELEQVKDTFESHWIGLGPKTKQFEKNFREYIGCRHAISLNSCTAALHLALIASDIKQGDEVLVSSMTFASSAQVVLYCGATPILVDVDKENLQMDTEDLKKKITSRSKAVIPVHYGGHICDMDKIITVARENGMAIIEDCANCTGAEYKNKKIGNLDSDFACFSFEAKKNMTTGDGGMLVTNKDDEIAERIRSIRWVGMNKDTLSRFSADQNPWEYDIIELGYKYNMNDIAAGIGIEQLKKLDDMNKKRKKIVDRYNLAFEDVSWIETTPEKDYSKNAYWLYIMRVNCDRDKFMHYLLDNGINANTSFKPLHMFTFFSRYYKDNNIEVNCPTAEKEWKRIVVLPLFPNMKEEQVDKVIEIVKSFKK